MGDLSPHFNRSEFAEHDNGALPSGMPTAELVAALERLRGLVGKPLTIVSGYRSPAYNAKVGGAPNSQHLYGRAADLVPGYATLAQVEQAGFTGIGINGRQQVVHVDVRPGSRVTFRDG